MESNSVAISYAVWFGNPSQKIKEPSRIPSNDLSLLIQGGSSLPTRELHGKELIPVPRHALRQAGRVQCSQTIPLGLLFLTENLQTFISCF